MQLQLIDLFKWNTMHNSMQYINYNIKNPQRTIFDKSGNFVTAHSLDYDVKINVR